MTSIQKAPRLQYNKDIKIPVPWGHLSGIIFYVDYSRYASKLM